MSGEITDNQLFQTIYIEEKKTSEHTNQQKHPLAFHRDITPALSFS